VVPMVAFVDEVAVALKTVAESIKRHSVKSIVDVEESCCVMTAPRRRLVL
jgi:hypothetical protein